MAESRDVAMTCLWWRFLVDEDLPYVWDFELNWDLSNALNFPAPIGNTHDSSTVESD